MHPYLPQLFHEFFTEEMARKAVREDPDGLLTEERGPRPDPVGLWLVRSADGLAARFEGLKARLSGRPRPQPRTTLSHEPEAMPRC